MPEAFSGRTATEKRRAHERKSIQTIAAHRAQAGRLPLPHDTGAEETDKQPYPARVLLL